MATERAKQFATALRNAAEIPVDVGDEIDMKLPEFADHDRIRRAQAVFKNNFFAIFYGMYCGLVAILAIPSILNVLVHTNKSSSDMTANKRYMQTIYHNLASLRLETHHEGSEVSIEMISQRNMILVQFTIIGFTVLPQKKNRCASEPAGDAGARAWQFNMCCETHEETLERLEVIRKDFLLPNLRNPPEEFASMARFIVNGLSCFDPFDTYNEMIFMVKRLSGVENFHYLQEEMPEDYERSNLKLLKLSYCDRIVIFLSVMSRQYLTRCFVFRWFFNFMTCIGEFFVRYFPIIAFFKFGFRRSYVGIS